MPAPMARSGSSHHTVAPRLWASTAGHSVSSWDRVSRRQYRHGWAGSPVTSGPTTTRVPSATTGRWGTARRRHGSPARASRAPWATRTTRSGAPEPVSRSSASTASAAHTPDWTRSTPSARSSLATEAARGPAPSTTTNRPASAEPSTVPGRTGAMDGRRRAAVEAAGHEPREAGPGRGGGRAAPPPGGAARRRRGPRHTRPARRGSRRGAGAARPRPGTGRAGGCPRPRPRRRAAPRRPSAGSAGTAR